MSVAFMAGIGATFALGVDIGTASADDVWGNHTWCPGDEIPQTDNPITWDMNVCHDWHYLSMRYGAPTPYWLVEGIQQSECPPLAFMCP